jgi:hypothetical protein
MNCLQMMCHERPSANKKIEADIGKSGQGRLIWCYTAYD